MPWPKANADNVIVTAKQMANVEAEILARGMPVPALMERVGLSMAKWFFEQPALLNEGVVVLVGPGHNGGDGLVVARELHLSGVNVSLWCPLQINKSLTAGHFSYVESLGIQKLQEIPDPANRALWIDALFGIGQTRPLPAFISQLLKAREEIQPRKLVSLDVPAGICSNTGREFEGGAAFAAFTLTVGLIKEGLVADYAIDHVGRLVRIDMGLSKSVLEILPKNLPLKICRADVKTISWPKPLDIANKYGRGRLMVLAGSDKYRGAAFLALRGALASGCGSIQAALPTLLANRLWEVAPEIVLKGVLPTFNSGVSIAKAFIGLDFNRIDSILIGPGIGKSSQDWTIEAEAIEAFPGLLVLDADALNRVASSEEGWHWFKKRKGPTWITPHDSEFKRLFPEVNNFSAIEKASEAARLSGASVLLKGAHTVVADPSGAIWQLCETAPWVARSGLGDVLAGFVAGAGAVCLASSTPLKTELLAASALLHAEAAGVSCDSSTASSIADSLSALVVGMNNKKMCLSTQ